MKERISAIAVRVLTLAGKAPWKRRIIFLWAILLLLVAIYNVYLDSTYEIAKISNLSVGYLRNNQIIVSETLPAGADRLFACGTITTRGSNYLAMTLLSKDEEMNFGTDRTTEPFPHGDFCTEIMIRAPLEAGLYKLIIINKHQRVGELIFQVK